jgi:hypothetical protein
VKIWDKSEQNRSYQNGRVGKWKAESVIKAAPFIVQGPTNDCIHHTHLEHWSRMGVGVWNTEHLHLNPSSTTHQQCDMTYFPHVQQSPARRMTERDLAWHNPHQDL